MSISTNEYASPYRDSEACPDCDGLLVDSECPACDEEEKKMTDVDRFYAHLSGCNNCGPDDLLCGEGVELLFEAGDALEEHWQDVGRAIHRRESLKREADAFYKFYATEEQHGAR